jgi:hypothetical protein
VVVSRSALALSGCDVRLDASRHGGRVEAFTLSDPSEACLQRGPEVDALADRGANDVLVHVRAPSFALSRSKTRPRPCPRESSPRQEHRRDVANGALATHALEGGPGRRD